MAHCSKMVGGMGHCDCDHRPHQQPNSAVAALAVAVAGGARGDVVQGDLGVPFVVAAVVGSDDVAAGLVGVHVAYRQGCFQSGDLYHHQWLLLWNSVDFSRD